MANKKRKKRNENIVRENVTMIVVAVISVLLFISLLGYGGIVGGGCRVMQFGMFGLCAYLFPFLLLGITIYLYVQMKQGSSDGTSKAVASVVLFLLLCMFVQLTGGNDASTTSLKDVWSYSVNYHFGGGFFGGVLEKIIRSAFGVIAAYIIDLAGMIICLVIITGKSFVGGVGNGSQKVYNAAKDDLEERRQVWIQNRELKKEERKRMRMEQRVSGVSLDTNLRGGNEAASSQTSSLDVMPDRNDALSEITPKESLQGLEDVTLEEPNDSYFSHTTVTEVRDTSTVLDAPAMSAPVDEDPTIPEYDTATVQAEETQADDEEQPEFFDSDVSGSYAYLPPPLTLLKAATNGSNKGRENALLSNQQKLQDTLSSFGVDVSVTGYEQGPTVTRYEILPAAGVKVSRILSLSDDLKLALAAPDIRIEAPIPGKSAIGIEVPNTKRVTVSLRELLESPAMQKETSKIAFAAGKNIDGSTVCANIFKMPHLLIAGATGSGKSVCINTIILSILFRSTPNEVKLIMIDPKVVELSIYNGIPNLMTPVVTDPKKAAGALNWAVQEMTRRYKLFADEHVRDMPSFNAKMRKRMASGEQAEILPQIVIIIDELADLMMVAPGEVEDAICRLAQLARAAGLHLVIATQRPSVNVITGLIKANMPSRIAFAVTSGVDSRTILDMNGAEKLLGNGDMLYFPQGMSKPKRVQGAFVSDEEVAKVVKYIKDHGGEYEDYDESITSAAPVSIGGSSSGSTDAEERDELFESAGRFLIESEKGSIGSLQRKFRIGFNRAARIVDQLEEAGVVGPEEGTKPRKILMSAVEFETYLGNEANV